MKKNVTWAECKGWKILHSCVKFVNPIDYDAIKKTNKEKEARKKHAAFDTWEKNRRDADAKGSEKERRWETCLIERERIQKERILQIQNALDHT